MAPTCVIISATEVSRKVNALADRYNRHTILQTQKKGAYNFCVDRDSSVGIATRYGLGGSDIESQ
jgi:hypothetical protein